MVDKNFQYNSQWDDYTPERKAFELPDAGAQQVVLADVIPLGPAEETFEGKTRQVFKMELWFQVAQRGSENQALYTRGLFNLSFDKKSKFLPFFEVLRGSKLTPDEESGKVKLGVRDVIALIGKNALLEIVHKPGSKGGTFANPGKSIMPLAKGTAPITVDPTFVRAKDKNGDGLDGFQARWFQAR